MAAQKGSPRRSAEPAHALLLRVFGKRQLDLERYRVPPIPAPGQRLKTSAAAVGRGP